MKRKMKIVIPRRPKLKIKRKVKRKEKTPEQMPTTYKRPVGGHLPFPPKDCYRPGWIQFFAEKNVPWIDLAICIGCTQKCQRRKEYLQQLKEERNAKRDAGTANNPKHAKHE